MSYWARLVHGHRYLDLATAPYDIGLDFSPPPLNRQVNYAGAARQNMEGSKRISEQYNDRNWAVSFRVLGNTEEVCNGAVRKLATFLENARNPRFKLYFEYYPHNATGFLPIYGQGVYRYHVKDAFVTINSAWGVRDQMIGGVINFLIGPTAEGLRQRLMRAKGHVHEDIIKTSTGESRGIYVAPNTKNWFKNPVFSNPTDWSTNWIAAGSVSAYQVTDVKNIPVGDYAVHLQSWGTAGTCNYTETINVGNTNAYLLSTYVKMMNGNAPGTADVKLWYGGTLGTFNSLYVGDGWYRIWNIFAGVASNTATGLYLSNPGVDLFTGGFQLESSLTTPTPFVYGDALGCVWDTTSARGSSTSTGGTALLALPGNMIDISSGCIRMVLKWDVPYSYSTNQYLFDARSVTYTDAFSCWYNQADDKYYFNAGGGSVSSAAQTFLQGDFAVIHISWGRYGGGSARTDIYVNGVATASSSFINKLSDSFLFIGTDYTGANSLRATILDFTVWRETLSSAAIMADYAQTRDWISSGDPGIAGSNDNLGNGLNNIPFLWTKDGDDIVDIIYDSTHNDWAVAAGIPGNLPAHTIFDIAITNNDSGDTGLIMANQAYSNYLDLGALFYGTDVALNVGTAAVSFPGSGTTIELIRNLDAYRGQKGYVITALTDGGTACQGAMVIHYNTEANAYISSYTSLATDSTKRWFVVGPIQIPESLPDYLDWTRNYAELNFKLKFKRLSGSGTITMDSYRLIAGDLLYAPISGALTSQELVVDGMDIYSVKSAKEDGLVTTYGDVISLYPGKYNHLVSIPTSIGRASNTADTITYSLVYVIPRWSTA